MGLAVVMFLSPKGGFASTITDFPSWEVGSEFNDTANPSGVWSYRSKATVGDVNAPLLTVPWTPAAPDELGWTNSRGFPLVGHNVHPTPFIGSTGAQIPAHGLFLHPGRSGQYAVVRFTAPVAGTYKVSGQFYALDSNSTGTTTDVWILVNNNTSTPLFSGIVNYYAAMTFASFTNCTTFTLDQGGTLEFEVGPDGNYNFDTTGLNAVIEKIL